MAQTSHSSCAIFEIQGSRLISACFRFSFCIYLAIFLCLLWRAFASDQIFPAPESIWKDRKEGRGGNDNGLMEF